jgi:hypothetical protein
MSELRDRMIADMTAAGFSASTKEVYLQGSAALRSTMGARPSSLARPRCAAIYCTCAISVVWRAAPTHPTTAASSFCMSIL